MALTDKQKEAYLADPSKCPFCGCIRIRLEDYSFLRHPNTWKESRCLNLKCGERWIDTYTLTKVDDL